jgi:hypothetical protein
MKKETLPSMVLRNPTGFFYDKTKNGWELVENVPLENIEPTLELSDFLQEGENYIIGTTMLERAKKLGNLAGQLHAERLLSQQQDIPKEWRDYYLVFAGTVWRDSDGNLYVPYLGWGGGRWDLNFDWLDNDFFSHARLARLRK